MKIFYLLLSMITIASCGGGGDGAASTEANTTATNSTLQFGNTTLGNAKFSQ